MALASLMILSLPVEIITEILLFCDYRDVMRCSVTCKTLRRLISGTTSIQYLIELGVDGYVDGSRKCAMPSRDRLQLLRQGREAWHNLRPHSTISPSAAKAWLAFDIAGGILVSYHWGSDNHLTIHRLPSRISEGSIAQYEAFPSDIKDFAMDPSQDLIVIVSGHRGAPQLDEDDMAAAGPDGILRMHLRTLSSGGREYHPNAQSQTLTVKAQPFLHFIKLQIAEDVLAIFMPVSPSALFIFNWKTGKVVQVGEEPDFTSDFSFLSPRAYMLADRRGALFLFEFDANVEATPGALPSVTLFLPDVQPDRFIAYVECHTGPFVSAAAEDTPFKPAHHSRLHIIVVQTDMETGGGGAAAAFVIWTDMLLYFIANTSAYKNINGLVPWSYWGPWNTRIIDLGWEDRISDRAVHGTRVVMNTRKAQDPSRTQVEVLDFNTSRHHFLNSKCLGVADNETNDLTSSAKFVDQASNAPPLVQSMFVQDLHSSLPYYSVILDKSTFDSEDEFLMDDSRLLRYPVSEENRERARMDIFVF